MELSIIIPTVPSRASLLSRLLWILEPQLNSRVEVIVHTGPKGVGTKCNRMFEVASGDLVVSFDDDDTVAMDYVASHLSAPGYVPGITDFIGSKMLVTRDGRFDSVLSHNLLTGRNSGDTTERSATLKCPLKLSVARQFTFEDHMGADFEWAEQVIRSKLLKHPIFMNDVFYTYDWSSAGTHWPPNGGVRRDRNVGMWPYNPNKFTWVS